MRGVRSLVSTILSSRGRLPETDIETVLANGGLHRFSLVFVHKTHATYNPGQNHEVAEFKGDTIVNDVIGQYIVHDVHPVTPLQGLAHFNLLRQWLVSKTVLAGHATTLGFDRVMAHNDSAPAFQRNPRLTRLSMLEDAFEAFVGTVTNECDRVMGTRGCGYAVAGRIVRSLLEEMPMETSLEAITSPKDRLKKVYNALHWPLNTVMLNTTASPPGRPGVRATLRGFFHATPDGRVPRPLEPQERRKISHQQAQLMGTMKETQRAELRTAPLRDLVVPSPLCFVRDVHGVDEKDAETKAAEAGLQHLASFGYVPYPKKEEHDGFAAPGAPPRWDTDEEAPQVCRRLKVTLRAFGVKEDVVEDWVTRRDVVMVFRHALSGAEASPLAQTCEFMGETLLTAAVACSAATVAPALPASEVWLTRFKHTVNSSKLFGRGLYHALELASLGGARGVWWDDTPAGRTDAVETFVGCLRHVLHTQHAPPYLHASGCFHLVAQQVEGALQAALRDGALVVSYQALFDPITRLRELFRQVGWPFSLGHVLPVWEEGGSLPPPAPPLAVSVQGKRRRPLVARPARAHAVLPGGWGTVSDQMGTSVQDARHRAAQAAIDTLIAAGAIAEPTGLLRRYEVLDPQVGGARPSPSHPHLGGSACKGRKRQSARRKNSGTKEKKRGRGKSGRTRRGVGDTGK